MTMKSQLPEITAESPSGRVSDVLIEGINLRLAMTGCPTFGSGGRLPGLSGPLFSRQKETMRLLANYLCPSDWRVQNFLRDYLYDTGIEVRLPSRTFVLNQPGLARLLVASAGS